MEFSSWHLGIPCAVGLAWAIWAREHRSRRRAERAEADLRQAQESTLRLLRLSTGDQRNLALTLIGHAEALQPADATLTGLARRLLELSDTLVEQTEAPEAPRFIADETLDVAEAIEFALVQVVTHLGPSRRVWRIAPELATTALLVDRRALNQVLVSVLTAAAAATRDGDWIEVSLQADETGITLVIQDEGIGLPMAQNQMHAEEGRGIGLRLTLARSLMHAHAGSLTVHSAERVGTRVALRFPPERLVRPAPVC